MHLDKFSELEVCAILWVAPEVIVISRKALRLSAMRKPCQAPFLAVTAPGDAILALLPLLCAFST